MRLLFSVCVLAQAQDDARATRTVLENQVKAWNRRDLAGYMKGYWNSDSTVFISGGRVLRGYQTVFERYQKTYGTPEQMGMLEFDELGIRFLANDVAATTGRWELTRANGQRGGRFTLLLHRTAEGWRIVYDHTSVGE